MREYVLPMMGITTLLIGLYQIVCLVLILTINKDSRLYKYLTKPNLNNWLEKYMHEHLSVKTNRTIQIFISVIVGATVILLGLNTLVKGLIDPYGPGFWVIF